MYLNSGGTGSSAAARPTRDVAPADEGDPSARLVLTDEPHNVPIAGHVTGGRHREFAMASGEMTDAEFLAFNEAWMVLSWRPRKPGECAAASNSIRRCDRPPL